MATVPPGTSLSDRIRAEARRLGFEAVGMAPLRPSDHAEYLRGWIAAGRHGTMEYLARPDALEARVNPGDRWPELKSAVVVAHHYAATSTSTSTSGGGTGVIARYARGRDYHRVVKKKLLALLGFVEGEVEEALPLARAYVDTGPVLERELARRAGLGWFGRNTMLIDPRRGSYFFLGVLLLPMELEPDAPFEADRCGSCTACLDACPTGALLGRNEAGAPILDARLCISYLTIENRGPIPEELRPAIGNRIYGCDICQEVCPWNSPRLVQVTGEPDYLPRVPGLSGSQPDPGSDTGTHAHPHAHTGPSTDSPSLIELMRMTREEWDVWKRGSAIRRAGYAGFKRNVAVAMGNWLGSVDRPPEDALAVLRDVVVHGEPLIQEHADWALRRAAEDRR
jgi:epoxyqueuosine reductase